MIGFRCFIMKMNINYIIECQGTWILIKVKMLFEFVVFFLGY